MFRDPNENPKTFLPLMLFFFSTPTILHVVNFSRRRRRWFSLLGKHKISCITVVDYFVSQSSPVVDLSPKVLCPDTNSFYDRPPSSFSRRRFGFVLPRKSRRRLRGSGRLWGTVERDHGRTRTR